MSSFGSKRMVSLDSFPWSWERFPGERPLVDNLLAVQEILFHRERLSFSFGIGNPAEQLVRIPSSYKEALGALQMRYQSRQTRFIQSYRTRETAELIKLIP